MKQSQFYVYIMANNKPILYIGVSNNLVRRVFEHKNKTIESFSNKYNLTKLVYFEIFDNIENAIAREKQLKHWNREWKLNLIRKTNPEFKDLYGDLL